MVVDRQQITALCHKIQCLCVLLQGVKVLEKVLMVQGIDVANQQTNALMHALDEWLPWKAESIAAELKEARHEWHSQWCQNRLGWH